MLITQTNLEGCFIIQPEVYKDARGYFLESFNKKRFEDAVGFEVEFVQDNQSKSDKGVLRGLHFQIGEFEQAKLVRVTKGSVMDVCVDLRVDSPTFKQYFSIILDSNSHQQLFIPRGFAHGFLVLEDDTIFSYKCDNYYNKTYDRGIRYNDPDLAIDWQCKEADIVLSDKDKNLPFLKEFMQWL